MANQNKSAIWFDGVNDHVALGTIGLPTGDNPRTIEFWAKPEDKGLGSYPMFSYGDNTTVRKFDIGFNLGNDPTYKGKVFVHVWGDLLVTKDVIFKTYNTWYHVAVVYSGGGLTAGLTLYINGIKQKLEGYTGYGNTTPLNTTSSNGMIGGRSDGQYYKGAIDELRVWSVTRLEAQINADMYKVLTGGETGLVGYWRFEEGLGSSVANDSSLSKNHGSLKNGANFVAGEIPLLAGQKVEEIGVPIDLTTGTMTNMMYKDGRLQLSHLYEIKQSDGSDDPSYVGDGTESSPYLLRDAYDVYAMRFKPRAYFKMVKDIDMGVEPFNNGIYQGFDFYGSLDGNGFKLMNLKIIGYQNYVGLFRLMLDNATIKNLYVEDAYVEGRGDIVATGILVGEMRNTSTINNVRVSGRVKQKGRSGDTYVGVIGNMIHSSSVTNFYTNAIVDIDDAGITKNYVGVVTGRMDSATLLKYVIVEGNIVGNTNSYDYIGVIVGYNYRANMTDVYYNRDYASMGLKATNNQAIPNAEKTEIDLQNARTFEKWDANLWRVAMWSKPKLKMFDKITHALYEYGEWESEIIDLVDKYTSLNKLLRTQNIMDGASIVVMTKTSEDLNMWTPYVPVNSDGTVSSPKARYARVKIRVYAGKSRQPTEVEGFSGNIDYDKSEFLQTNTGTTKINNTKRHEFQRDETYSGGGFVYKTKLFSDTRKQLDKIRISPR